MRLQRKLWLKSARLLLLLSLLQFLPLLLSLNMPLLRTASDDKAELCGAAAETLAYEAPEKDLCRAGIASVVNGDGPWTWSCTTNEGTTSSCRTLSLNGDAAAPAAPAPAPAEAVTTAPAPEAAVASPPPTPVSSAPVSLVSAPAPVVAKELACGLAASQPTMQMPTTELCQNGKASAVRGPNPWQWTCSKGHTKVSCETPKMQDGSCGPANGTSLKSAPFTGLCSTGTPSGIEGTGPWTWVCNGSGGGVDTSCAASLQSKPDKIDGACGNADGSNVY